MHFGFIKDLSVKSENLHVGLDVGTSKVCVVVGEESTGRRSGVGQDGSGLDIMGIGTAPSRGVKKGVITNIESTAESIGEAVEEAEASAGVDIKAVHIGITGGHIGCLTSHGVLALREKLISQKEVDSVIDAARAVALPFDREMIHVIPSGFTVNGQNGITDPRGMSGVRLETNVQIITCATTSMQNLVRSCEKAGLAVLDVIFQPLASAETVITEDEKELGVAVIDIGGGTTDIALFHKGTISHASVMTIGGDNFTNDVAVGLRIPTNEAERLKWKSGCAMLSMVKDNEEAVIGEGGGGITRVIPRNYLVEILQPRAEELFSLVKKEIVEKDLHKHMNSGVVLTGGAVLMEGMDVMAENILELPVRIGTRGDTGLSDVVADNPLYSSAIGLALHGPEECSETDIGKGRRIGGMKRKVAGWFRGAFR